MKNSPTIYAWGQAILPPTCMLGVIPCEYVDEPYIAKTYRVSVKSVSPYVPSF